MVLQVVHRIKELVLYYSQEEETGTIMFSGEGNMCSPIHIYYSYIYILEIFSSLSGSLL